MRFEEGSNWVDDTAFRHAWREIQGLQQSSWDYVIPLFMSTSSTPSKI